MPEFKRADSALRHRTRPREFATSAPAPDAGYTHSGGRDAAPARTTVIRQSAVAETC